MYCKYALSDTYHTYEPHTSFSVGRKGISSFASVRIHKYYIHESLESVIQNESLSFILKIYKNSKTMVEQGT
jgi:hypothetical protein